MRTLSLILISLATVAGTTACTDRRDQPTEELVREGGLVLDPETRQPFSGAAFATFEPGTDTLAGRLAMLNRAYDGPFQDAFPDRRVSSKETYEEGVKNGPYEWYFESGQIFETGTYVDGRLDGPYRAYWETGELYEEGTYENGDYDGPRRWYVDGRLIELVTYRYGVVDGLYERYREDGTLDLKGMLVDGQPCGMWIENDRSIAYDACGMSVTD